jgi:aarF domain-containing kinase
MWPPAAQRHGRRLFAAAAVASMEATAGSGRRRKVALSATASLVATAALAHRMERSGQIFADSGPAAALVTAVRFTRALAASAQIMVDYRILFAQHDDYTSDEYKERRSAVHSRAAEKLLRLCKTQGAVYVKIGQHVASMNHAVPPEFTSKLVQLEDRAAFRPFRQIERVLRDELGGEVSDHFATFPEEPVAAASLAQVHRATLAGSGEAVACKVQYPGLATLVAGDLASIRFLSLLLTRVFPHMSLDWIVDQFKENLGRELDFTQEAASSERTRAFFASSDDRVAVPAIYPGLSTSRVLTMEFVDGFRVDDAEQLDAAGIRREDVAAAVVDAFGKMVFINGFVHCDGHGGNLMVRPRPHTDRRATGQFDLFILDHGLYRELSDDFRRAYCRLWRGLVLRRAGEVDRACTELGAPGLGNIFSIVLLNRSWSSARSAGVDLRNKMSREEMRELMRELRDGGVESGADAVAMFEGVPTDLLLVIKSSALVRNINQSLGAQVDRFRSNVRHAVLGLHHRNALDAVAGGPVLSSPGMLAGKSMEEDVSAPWLGTRLWRWFHCRFLERVALWTDIAVVEANLALFDVLLALHRWFYGASSAKTLG